MITTLNRQKQEEGNGHMSATDKSQRLREWGRFLAGARLLLGLGAVCAAVAAFGAWSVSSGSPLIYATTGTAVVCQTTGIAAINKMLAALAAFA